MRLVVDSREKMPLSFPKTHGVKVEKATLNVGDYGGFYASGEQMPSVVERKSIADLFNSFTSPSKYKREKNKIQRAADLGYRYIIAIESPALRVLEGYNYVRGGVVYESKKTGIAQLRQMMTISQKYEVDIWYCNGREEMAIRILEWFLSYERRLRGQKRSDHGR